MFDEQWFFQRLHECVDMLRMPMEEIRDRMDLMLKFQLVELPCVGSSGGVVSLAPEAIATMSPHASSAHGDTTWITMRGEAGVEWQIALPYEETKKRLGIIDGVD